jgi:hypothetical protein
MVTRAVATAFVVLAAAGCGNTHKSAADPARNADACRAYNDALILVRAAMKPPRAALAVQTAVADASPKVDAAAQLAYDTTRADMQRSAAALRLWGGKQQDYMQPGFSDNDQASAVRNTAGKVTADCKEAAVTVTSVG